MWPDSLVQISLGRDGVDFPGTGFPYPWETWHALKCASAGPVWIWSWESCLAQAPPSCVQFSTAVVTGRGANLGLLDSRKALAVGLGLYSRLEEPSSKHRIFKSSHCQGVELVAGHDYFSKPSKQVEFISKYYIKLIIFINKRADYCFNVYFSKLSCIYTIFFHIGE